MYLFANLVGRGAGPLLVGALSDALRPYLGIESLRYALLAMCPGYLIAGWFIWHAARYFQADADAAESADMLSSEGCSPAGASYMPERVSEAAACIWNGSRLQIRFG